MSSGRCPVPPAGEDGGLLRTRFTSALLPRQRLRQSVSGLLPTGHRRADLQPAIQLLRGIRAKQDETLCRKEAYRINGKGLIGVLMCGLSASFLFAIVIRLVEREARVSDTPVTDTGDTSPETRIRQSISRLSNGNFLKLLLAKGSSVLELSLGGGVKNDQRRCDKTLFGARGSFSRTGWLSDSDGPGD